MDIKDILEMKKNSANAEFDEMIKGFFKKLILHIIGMEGVIIIKRDLDKEHIRCTLESCKVDIIGRFINPLKKYISPDTYMEINEFLRGEIDESIEILCSMYYDRHKLFDLVEVLKETLGGEDDED